MKHGQNHFLLNNYYKGSDIMNIHFKDINMRIKKAHMEDTVLALLKQENISKEEYDNDFGIKNKIADIIMMGYLTMNISIYVYGF